jgi:hypothetical protein
VCCRRTAGCSAAAQAVVSQLLLTKNTQVQKLFTEPVKPFFDPRKQCSACLFVRNNQTAKTLATTQDYNLVQIDNRISHVNFP